MNSAQANGWKPVKLKEVCEYITVGFVGSMTKHYADEGIPFLRSQNIQPFKLDLSSLQHITPEFHKKIKKSALSPGDVVVVRTGYPGTACVIPKSLSDSNCADLVIIHPKDNLDSHFLAAIFNSSWGRSSVAGNLVGVAQQHFNVGAAKEMKIFLPSLVVQRKIAAVLSADDDLIENNTRRIAILEEMAQRLYREWFVHFRFPRQQVPGTLNAENDTSGEEGNNSHNQVPGTLDAEDGRLPKGWEVKRLGDLACEVRRSVHPDEISPTTPYIGLGNMPKKSIALTDWGTADEVGSTKLAFKKGEILFGKIRPYFHKVGVAQFDGVASTDAIVIAPKEQNHFSLVLGCVSSEEFVAHATQTSKGTKMPRADWNVLVKYSIAFPPQHILQQFNDIIEPIVDLIHNIIFRNENLRQTRDLLLPRLISGELDVSELDIKIVT